MPNSKTFNIKPIKELIKTNMVTRIVDPFANKSKIANVTNDIDTQYNTNYLSSTRRMA